MISWRNCPRKQQQAIKKRTAELIAEEATLRQLREARERSQVEMAKKLHINQAAVSKLERRTDMYLSTLRGFIEAMGGKLEIVARFPNQAVRITQFEMLDPESGRRGKRWPNVPSLLRRSRRNRSPRGFDSNGEKTNGLLLATGVLYLLSEVHRTMAEIILINPRFEVSYWGLEHALPLIGKQANMPIACLPLLAALTPPGHSVTLVDENMDDIDFDRCARADIVGLTGMVVQRGRMLEILAELKRRGAFVVVGGAWVTVKEDDFDGLADVVFIGEAEQTWPRFLDEWQRGEHRHRYEQAERTDMATVPTPRFDMLNMKDYLFGNVQFTRGCPFQCEFCDIIVTFGRKPRIKTSRQILAELDALLAQGVRGTMIVDDNLIGNKKAIRPVLHDVIAWQERHGYPMTFFTEASIDLADEPELMRLMVEANIVNVFVGIESPNDASLRKTKKFQNVRSGGTPCREGSTDSGSGHGSHVRDDPGLRP